MKNEELKQILKSSVTNIPAGSLLLIQYPESLCVETVLHMNDLMTEVVSQMERPVPFIMLPDLCKISVVTQEDAEIQKREPPTFLGVPLMREAEFPPMPKCKPPRQDEGESVAETSQDI